ncbi:MAG: FAD-binding protein [Anaerolineae bacterium]
MKFTSSKITVGTAGERVAPDLYIALGIRGDTQHTWGMKGCHRGLRIRRRCADLEAGRCGDCSDLGKFAGELAKLLSSE